MRRQSIRILGRLCLGTLSIVLGLSACTTLEGDDSAPAITPANTRPAEEAGIVTPPQADDQENERLLATYGGAYRNARLERYLDDLVQRLAAQSDRPDISYRITILNASSINAFALPSGRLYVTRGLLALANDDAEIAAVIAHEMAHVSARHALARANLERKSQLVSSVMTDILHDKAGGKARLQRAQVDLAGFSRLQELDADTIGVRTIAKAGFDPNGAFRFLNSMRRHVEARTKPATPDFLSTHPSTPERIKKAQDDGNSLATAGSGEHDRYQYLSVIDGLPFGDDPDQGYIQGRTFWQPRLGFTVTAPTGFRLENTPQAVLGTDNNGQALRLDTVKLKSGQTLAAYLGSGWISGVEASSVETQTINGNETATAIAKGQDWTFRLYAIRMGGNVYRLILASRNLDAATDALFRKTAASFRRMTADEQSRVRTPHIDVVTVRAGDTVQTIAARMAGPVEQLERFLILNGFDASTQIKPGDRLKIISL